MVNFSFSVVIHFFHIVAFCKIRSRDATFFRVAGSVMYWLHYLIISVLVRVRYLISVVPV